MPKCNKVKNPCKICLNPVSNKTGIQCQGACQSWVHYECLNYTPGKIKDIKAGIIRISCPCPDCKTSLPKEYRTDQPFSCSNSRCPANSPPKCGNTGCPINGMGNGVNESPVATGCALDKCGKSCKPNSKPQMPHLPQIQPVQPCAPPHYPLPVSPTLSDACISYNKCPSGCSSSHDVPGDYGRSSNPMPSFGALEKMCNTVGQLTDQINDLMTRMKQTVDKSGAGAKCTQRGNRAACPKPCFCPGNPGRRN